MKYSVPRGTKDILPSETPLWQSIEAVCRKTFALYNYQEIRTPIFESTELFSRAVGKTTDIVSKEMYEFKDKKGRSLVLRPEETAAVVRAGLENNLIGPDQLTKLYYIGPMFRYERPQKGRQRQFHQVGVEVFGSNDPLIDVEVITLNLQLLEKVGVKELEVNLNSVGCPQCQPDFRKKLKEYFTSNVKKMCPDCQNRFDNNPLRILDCKEGKCQSLIEGAPSSLDTLCPECKTHFDGVLCGLNNLKVKYNVNRRLVRGLDYYSKTAFEITSGKLGAQNAVSGGGRYDNLVEEFGGKSTPAVGFAIGLERVVDLMLNDKCQMTNEGRIILYIAALGEEAKTKAFDLLTQLRVKGIAADMDYLGKSLKAQLKTADRLQAERVLIIGDQELQKGSGVLKSMASGEQKEIPLDIKSLEEAL
ncbi:MAG: histidine--tRNA ligase [bacterium]